ncbi:uncharacterized protein LACBIDRAFT_299637 [Laccaria bicolor S238N-H82]|uniref:Predicted protein n=1 Tax=Laccaria bicolor (strain S238N-H82 / ATCC MYA-4686) TaxID=486041 RepID=B0DF20_LACBS|nr:uncharacterized protein LACBIDRAFT_299637 [Laccaria bicolor S238N-H82]EDR06643.1 predicted protein [Laccaria bicolor S238N-H82]|eukprot:XP_001882490.1 predicted protein [Laccaria bicolor S238N-H82]
MEVQRTGLVITAYSADHWDSVFCSAGGVSISNIYPKCTLKSHVAHSFDESATPTQFFPTLPFLPPPPPAPLNLSTSSSRVVSVVNDVRGSHRL